MPLGNSPLNVLYKKKTTVHYQRPTIAFTPSTSLLPSAEPEIFQTDSAGYETQTELPLYRGNKSLYSHPTSAQTATRDEKARLYSVGCIG